MQNRAWIFVPQGCALASAFRKPRADLLGGGCLGLGPSSTETCCVMPVTPLGLACPFCRMGNSPALPTEELRGTCFDSKVRNLSKNQANGRIVLSRVSALPLCDFGQVS